MYFTPEQRMITSYMVGSTIMTSIILGIIFGTIKLG